MDRASFDAAKESLTVEEAARRCGTELRVYGSGDSVRLDCPFDCHGDHAGKREISVNAGHRDKLMRCFRYAGGERCPFQGDIVHLVHGLLSGTRPPAKITGTDFRRARDVILGKAASQPVTKSVDEARSHPEPPKAAASGSTPAVAQKNVPLARSDNERTRELVGVEELFVTDAGRMRPKVADYWRARRNYLTDEICEQWGVGVRVAGGQDEDKRAWTLRNHVCYVFWSEKDEALAIIGRDPEYESKLASFESLPPEKKRDTKPPAKHKFPMAKLFARGLELYGQQRSRLENPDYREFIAEHGVIVVEGFNDVLRLEAAGVPAVGICSNQLTEAQARKVIRFARTLASGRISLWFDCDSAGNDGAMRAMWLLKTECPELDVRTAWSQEMHGGGFAGSQPESLSEEDIREVLLPALWRGAR